MCFIKITMPNPIYNQINEELEKENEGIEIDTLNSGRKSIEEIDLDLGEDVWNIIWDYKEEIEKNTVEEHISEICILNGDVVYIKQMINKFIKENQPTKTVLISFLRCLLGAFVPYRTQFFGDMRMGQIIRRKMLLVAYILKEL